VHKFRITALIAFVFAAPVEAQSLLLNGSFESPIVAANSSSLITPTSWQGNEIFVVNGDFSTRYPLPQDGQQYALLGHMSALSQAFTINSPGTRILKWFDSSEFNGPGNQALYSVTVTDSANNTVGTADLDANALALRQWTQRSIPLTLGTGTYTLRFQGNAPMFGEKPLIDNVSLVPETSTASLLCAVGLMLVRRRRG
jgi:hypothetical protein